MDDALETMISDRARNAADTAEAIASTFERLALRIRAEAAAYASLTEPDNRRSAAETAGRIQAILVEPITAGNMQKLTEDASQLDRALGIRRAADIRIAAAG
ncbi:hypothetical protein ACFVAJ_18545 [Agromyces sp. NPDC057679]|uniref:hypothetical protein n=1 Tax=Agromyces sp. NPDC057679 TaxID=3346207 RepID=UPI00366D0810